MLNYKQRRHLRRAKGRSSTDIQVDRLKWLKKHSLLSPEEKTLKKLVNVQFKEIGRLFYREIGRLFLFGHQYPIVDALKERTRNRIASGEIVGGRSLEIPLRTGLA